jgi:PRTRC genetic system protein C
MTEPTAKPLTRVFKLGSVTTLPDVNPAWSPQRVIESYVPNYPYLAYAQLSEPVVVNGTTLEYSIIKPAVQTKGAPARKAVDAALADIARWADEPVANPESHQHWVPVLRRLDDYLRDTSSAALDPFLIPLA